MRVCLFFWLCISPASLLAQGYNHLGTKSKKALEFYVEGDQHFIRRNYPTAIEFFEKALKKDDQFVEAWFRKGGSHYQLMDFQNAQVSWENGLAIADRAGHSYLLYHLGKLYFELGDYENSKRLLTEYVEISSPNERNLGAAKRLLGNASFAKESIAENIDFNPRQMPQNVNYFQLQYFPVVPVDQKSIVFTRRVGYLNSDDEDIYISKLDENGDWLPPESISDNINTLFNEGTCSISANGRMLIFTSCYGRESMGSCDLYMSRKSGEIWSEPENMGPNINSGAWESQPALSADGRVLYFVSDRKSGSVGSRDIWVSRKNDKGEWTRATNLGKQINTELDEVSPFLHPNGSTLYFASKGHTGLGGFDIFFSEHESNTWSLPRNVGYPLNTLEDQVSLFITADGNRGFYSEEFTDSLTYERRSIIFEFDVPKELQVTWRSYYVRGKVYDALTKKEIGADIELMNLRTDSRVLMSDSDSVTGEYLMVLTEGSEYGLFVHKPGYLHKSLSFDLEKNEIDGEIEIDIFLEPIRPGATTRLNNIFFESNSFELDPKSRPELDKATELLLENSSVKVRIEGHTDNIGEPAYNLDLSKKRSESVYNYLISNGLDKERLSFTGHGENRPLVPNDSEENRAVNRRIEFVILEN